MSSLPRYRDLPIAPGQPPKTAWGMFGEHDDLGTVQLQTAERIQRAATLVKTGQVFSLNWELDKPNPPLMRRGAFVHTLHREVEIGHHSDDHLDNFYPQGSTQWDGLTHVGDYEHGFWGGVTVAELRASGDKSRLGVDHWARRGIVGRAVVLDVARERARQGRPLDLTRDDKITIDDLESTRASQGVDFEPGDVWLLRTGWVGWYEQQPQSVRDRLAAEKLRVRLPGLACSEAMAEYIFDRHPAALAADNTAVESWPPPSFTEPDGFLHHFLIGRFGMALGEMFVLDALADACAAQGRYDCFFTSAPLNLSGGAGSPANALAIL
jgi:kynurenine formamidase